MTDDCERMDEPGEAEAPDDPAQEPAEEPVREIRVGDSATGGESR